MVHWYQTMFYAGQSTRRHNLLFHAVRRPFQDGEGSNCLSVCGSRQRRPRDCPSLLLSLIRCRCFRRKCNFSSRVFAERVLSRRLATPRRSFTLEDPTPGAICSGLGPPWEALHDGTLRIQERSFECPLRCRFLSLVTLTKSTPSEIPGYETVVDGRRPDTLADLFSGKHFFSTSSIS